MMTEIQAEKHLPWNDVDFYGLKLILKEWACKGFSGELDMKLMEAGVVTIITASWCPGHAPYIMMQLHKLEANNRWFWVRKKWGVQLFFCQTLDGALPARLGCVSGKSIFTALENAIREMGNNFVIETKAIG